MKILKCFKTSDFWKQMPIPLAVIIDEFDCGRRDSRLNHTLAQGLQRLTLLLSHKSDGRAIEAMFKDCKTGGYNLESTYTTNQRLIALILLIAIAYSCAVLSGRRSRSMGIQKYIGRLNELQRTCRRHSAFWVGLYGQLWIGAMESWTDLASALIRSKPNKLPYFQRGIRAMVLIQSAL